MSENTITLHNTDAVVKAIRYTVRSITYWTTFVEENKVTVDRIAPTANALAALAFPNDKPIQKVDGKRTRYGNAVQAAAAMMRKVLADNDETDNKTTPDWLALAVQAAKNANAHEISADDILTAVTAALVTGTES